MASVREVLEDDMTSHECIDAPFAGPPEADCVGPVEYRMALSGSGESFPRCAKHWGQRLDLEEGINRRYPPQAPRDWSPADIGEVWEEEA